MATKLSEVRVTAPGSSSDTKFVTDIKDLAESNALLGEVMDAVRACIDEHPLLAFALSGSAATGEFDAYSDIDLVIGAADHDQIAQANAAVAAISNALGTELLSFPGDHLGASNLHVAYLLRDGAVRKLDALVIDLSQGGKVPAKLLPIHDPMGRLVLTGERAVDSDALLDKLIAWQWFTYSRIARGEWFAAARSIDFSREAALLPVMLSRLGLPQDGHRRIESRLPVATLDALRQTHPAALEPRELSRALEALRDTIFEELRVRDTPTDDARRSALNIIWKAIERDLLMRDGTN